VYRLAELGWNLFFENQRSPMDGPEWTPSRVVEEGRGLYRLAAEAGEQLAELAGKVRLSGEAGQRLPAVGDWVLASWPAGGHARIERVLSARTRFSRRAAGTKVEEQVLAANIDTVFLVTSCNQDFNLRRLERYLAAAWASGARPVVVLNKADLVSEPEAWKAEAESILIGVPVLLASAVREEGVAALKDHVPVGDTAAFLGSSGVGKSSLINALIGSERQRVGAVRASDDRGRHNTTSRQLLLLEGGGALIDTPGLRELQLWGDGEGLESAFQDVHALAAGCRFRDCRHQSEPGCAVLEAEASGGLDAGRLQGYRKLEREQEFLESRQDPALRSARLQKFKRLIKEQRRSCKQ
jgi:ribosome biogenesis GTPase